MLETERLVLREITSDDLQWYFEHFSTPEIVEGQGFPPPENLSAAKEELERYVLGLFKEGTGFRWGITLKGQSKLIGSCGFYKWDKELGKRAEIGYDLNPKYWGKGIMREALDAMIEFGFEKMGLNRIEVLIMTTNDRSVKLIESLGFRKEGLMREHATFNGKWVDDLLYALLKREWLAQKRR